MHLALIIRPSNSSRSYCRQRKSIMHFLVNTRESLLACLLVSVNIMNHLQVILHDLVFVCLSSERYVSPLFGSTCQTPGDNDSTSVTTHSEHRFPVPSTKLPHLVTPLKGHSLSPRSCPPTRSAPSERFRY